MNIKKFFLFTVIAFGLAAFSATTLTSCSAPGDVDIQHGAKLFSQKKFNDARACFELALEEECSFPKDTIYIYIANCYSQTGDYEKAIEWRKKALEIAEYDTNYLQLGMIYRVLQDDDTAETMFKRALELNPSADAYASLGSLYMTKENYFEACRYLENSLDMNEKNAIVHADLAVCYAHLGQFEEAEEEFVWAEKYKCDNLDQFRKQLNDIMDK